MASPARPLVARLLPLAALVGTLAVTPATIVGQPSGQPSGQQSGGQPPREPRGQSSRPGESATPPRDSTAAPAAGTTAVLSGVIRAADTGRPLARARVMASSRDGGGRTGAETNDQGRFELRDLVPGRYTVTVSKPGFVTLSLGQKRPRQPAIPLALRAGERLENVDFMLPRGGVISGHVLDENGAPVVRAMVQAQRYEYRQGVRRLTPDGMDLTDDRGEYRIFDLMPGEYYVTASMGGRGGGGRFFGGPPGFGGGGFFGQASATQEDDEQYAPTYYPGTTVPDGAGKISVGLSQELTNVDFPLLLMPTTRIEGVVEAPAGSWIVRGSVMLQQEGGSPLLRYMARFGAEGWFELTRVPPGAYRLVARGNVDGIDTPLVSSVPLTVGGGVMTGIHIILSRGTTVAGRVVFDGATPEAGEISRVQVVLRPQDDLGVPGGNVSRAVNANGTFSVTNVPAGPRLLAVQQLPTGWSLKSAMLGDRDVADLPFDVKENEPIGNIVVSLTSLPSTLTGMVRNDRGDAVTDYTVIVFPADEALWHPQSRRVAARRPDQLGQYEVKGLPAGSYLVAAVDVVEEGEWSDPAFLAQLKGRSLAIALTDGAQQVRDLKVVSAY